VPSPTYVYKIDIRDNAIVHLFTFWLTYGMEEFTLYVMQADYELVEDWDECP
jgi:hypothetical protein